GAGGGVSAGLSGSNINSPYMDSGEDQDREVFRFTAEKGGRTLLRTDYFGEYQLSGWKRIAAEPPHTWYLTAEALDGNGYSASSAAVETLVDYGYLLPYYPVKNTVDTTLRNYTVSYYTYDYIRSSSPLSLSPRDSEKEYRAYVYDTYLALPAQSRTAMLEHLESVGLDASSMTVKDIVVWVEKYVKGAAKYDKEFPAYPNGVDTAVYFLTEAKSGVCRHFATAATVAYRALGIPARYVVGFAVDASEGETVSVFGRDAHAWVEVYIDSLGWVSVDPTAAISSGSGGGDEGGEDEIPPDESNPIKVILTMNDVKRQYDGKPLTAEDAGHSINTQLFGNDELIIEYDGECTEPGNAVSSIVSCMAVNEFGEDVSYRYEFDYSDTGILEVTKRKVTVISDSASKIYDGKELICHEYAVASGQSPLLGHRVKVEFNGSQTEIGYSDNFFDAFIVDNEGNAVDGWENYYEIGKEYGELKVAYSVLLFATDSATKVYDGTPLSASDTCELVGGELMPGHALYSEIPEATRIEPGISRNIPTVVITNAEGEDVTWMYVIGMEHIGVLSVTRIPITVRSESAEARFDTIAPGGALTCYDFTIEGSLLEGHRAEVYISGAISTVGICDNQIDDVIIVDENGEDVTKYYNVETECGELKILPPA
ncbi:MAG: transglutaminase domain-containing protein, partial [Clostridia bacterium]|nr:transglutaminase domain-containing protein [Clostridia bacterium]